MTRESDYSVAYDCRYYLGDRPCKWHKQMGVFCECEYYRPMSKSLAIIKLDAMGDVLRTTCLLPAIEKAWPGSRIIWITRKESLPLLENNPYITELIPYTTDAIAHMSSRSFERIVNLDATKVSAALATMGKSKETVGYILHPDGYVKETNAAAGDWLRMGIFDNLKKANQRTYQEIMCSILGILPQGLKYVLELTNDEKAGGRDHLLRLGIDLSKSIIGLHTGGGGRWKYKQWHEERFVGLISEIFKEVGDSIQVLLFGGPLERERNQRIREAVGVPVFDAGCENEVRHFASLVSHCSVVVSGDSLAMHIALAMGKRVVILFGPTSHTEIDLFGQGEKLIPDLDCIVCYKNVCDCNPNCMDLISVDMVKEAIFRQLNIK